MTCIVAIVDGNGKIIMGADSSAVDETIHTAHLDSKVFKKGEFGIGYCHSFRMGQIIEFWFTPPEIPDKEENMMRYMVQDFVPELKSILADNDYPNHEDEKTEWAMIVGIRGHLFTIESDWHVGYDDISYVSIGAGASYAIGAMYSVLGIGHKDAQYMARTALEAAEKFCPYVIKPFNFIEV